MEKSRFKNAIYHLKTITNHKLIVMSFCFKVGLYKQGILHDLSKYKWIEFSAGIKYFQGNMSPNGVQRREEGVSRAWLHHKGRNKHHYEYWIDYALEGNEVLAGMKMPINYTVEMFLDRVAASKNYQKENYKDSSPLEYYENGKKYCILHEETRKTLELLLNKLSDEGEEKTLKYIKDVILKK